MPVLTRTWPRAKLLVIERVVVPVSLLLNNWAACKKLLVSVALRSFLAAQLPAMESVLAANRRH